MRNDLFPVVHLTAEFWDTYKPSSFARSRMNALKEAFLHRAVFTGMDAGLMSGLRRVENWQDPHYTLENSDRWEDCLAAPFASQLVECGDDAARLLEPALEANDKIWILDKHLFPFNDNGSASEKAEQFNKLAHMARNATVLHVVTSFPKSKQPACLHVERLKAWLTDIVIMRPGQLTEMAWYLCPAWAPIHDRYIGFQRMTRGQELPWHVTSIGYGLRSLMPGTGWSTLTRIPSGAFLEEWKRALRLCREAVFVSKHTTSLAGWEQAEETPIEAGWNLSILKRPLSSQNAVAEMSAQ